MSDFRKVWSCLRLALSALLSCSTLLHAQTTPHYQKDFPPDEFKARWEKIFDRIGTNAVAIVQGMPQVSGFIFPRQNNEFYYLYGIETPHSYTVLDGQSRTATLYQPPRNERLERAEGRVLSADDAKFTLPRQGVSLVVVEW